MPPPQCDPPDEVVLASLVDVEEARREIRSVVRLEDLDQTHRPGFGSRHQSNSDKALRRGVPGIGFDRNESLW